MPLPLPTKGDFSTKKTRPKVYRFGLRDKQKDKDKKKKKNKKDKRKKDIKKT